MGRVGDLLEEGLDRCRELDTVDVQRDGDGDAARRQEILHIFEVSVSGAATKMRHANAHRQS